MCTVYTAIVMANLSLIQSALVLVRQNFMVQTGSDGAGEVNRKADRHMHPTIARHCGRCRAFVGLGRPLAVTWRP
jgi:hypothetical protein